MEQAVNKSDMNARSFSLPCLYAVLGAASVIILAGFFSGFLTLNGVQEKVSPTGSVSGNGFFKIFLWILSQNLPVFLTLVSGVISCGISSLLSGFTVGIYVGATFALSANTIGLSQLIQNVWPYFFFEIAAFLIAIAAGILPAATSIKKSIPPKTIRKSYFSAVPLSALLGGSGLGLLIIAALVETLVIFGRS